MGLIVSPMQLFPLAAYLVLADRVLANDYHLWVPPFAWLRSTNSYVDIRSFAATYKASESHTEPHTAALVTNVSPVLKYLTGLYWLRIDHLTEMKRNKNNNNRLFTALF